MITIQSMMRCVEDITRMAPQQLNINVVSHRLLHAVQSASLLPLIIHNMTNFFSVIFKRKKKAGLARTASQQSTSSVSSLAASPTPVRKSVRIVRSA
jgi:hypothetical protein